MSQSEETEKTDEKKPVRETLKEERERATELLKNIEEQRKATEEKIAELRQLQAEMNISGSSDAGQEPKKESDDDRIKRESNEFLKGTGHQID